MNSLLKLLSLLCLATSALAIALSLVLLLGYGSHKDRDLLPMGWGMLGLSVAGKLWLLADISEPLGARRIRIG